MKNLMLIPLVAILLLSTSLQAQEVYITKTGEKYHRGTCQYLRYSKIAVSLVQAQKNGYGACKVCRPPTQADGNAIENRISEPTLQKQAPEPRSTTVQCSAKTQAGSRCKRMTTNASGRCWQHE